jgi:hypothetical protein
MTIYIISYEDTFIVLQSLLLSILLLTAFCKILFYNPYDIMILLYDDMMICIYTMKGIKIIKHL